MGIFLLFVTMGWSFIENLKTSDQLQLRPANYQRTLDSMVSFDFCSGVFISNKGHVLTALHCFEGFYPKEMQQAPKKKVYGRWEYGFKPKEVFGPGRRVNPGFIAGLTANGKDIAKMDIIFSGERLGVNYLDTAAEDFIIIKLPVDGPTACSPVSVRRPQSSELLWAYGYPSAFVMRNGVEQGDSETLKISNGRVSLTVAQSMGKAVDFVKGDADATMQEFMSDTAEYRKNTYLVSTDTDEGMSGGPVFDKQGYVIGNIAVAVPTVLPSDRRRLGMQSTVGLLHAMRATMSEEQIAEVFDCSLN